MTLHYIRKGNMKDRILKIIYQFKQNKKQNNASHVMVLAILTKLERTVHDMLNPTNVLLVIILVISLWTSLAQLQG